MARKYNVLTVAQPDDGEPDTAADHPFQPASWNNRADKKGSKRPAPTVETDPAPAGGAGFMSAGLQPENAQGLGEPSAYLKKALGKKPKDRTPQEVEALKVRSRAEEITTKSGGKVMGGIMTDLIAEERAPGIGRREAKAAVGYYEGQEETLKANGRGPDGRKLDPTDAKTTTLPAIAGTAKTAGAAAPQAAPAAGGTSGGTITKDGKTTTIPATPGAPALPEGAKSAVKPTPTGGFAMRTMPDGSVKTASGLNPAGSSNMQNFATKEAAMAFYRSPAPVAPPQAPTGPGGAPATAMTAHNGQPASYASPMQPGAPVPAPATQPGAPAPAPQTPAAARTTSPTAKLEMAGGTPGAAPATPTTPPPAVAAGLATPLPGGGYNLTPGLEARRGQDAAAAMAKPLAGGGHDLTPGLEARRAQDASVLKNPFSPDRPEFEKGTPKPTGFQEDSETLAVNNPFSSQ